jgi:hypothetical protein
MCSTHFASSRAAWIALWMVKPAGLIGYGDVQDDAAVDVDLDQARGRDLLEQHPVGIDEEMVLRARDARGDVREHQVVPAEHRDQAVRGREVHALLPFLGRDLSL